MFQIRIVLSILTGPALPETQGIEEGPPEIVESDDESLD